MKRLAIIGALLMVALLPGAIEASVQPTAEAAPPPVPAAVNQYSAAGGSCTQIWHAQGDPVPFVCLTEKASYSGAKLTLTGSSDLADLNLIVHIPDENCDQRPPWQDLDDRWNDCISAVWAKLGTNDSFCIHPDSYYHGLIWWAAAPSSPSGGVWTYQLADFGANNNVASSLRLQQSGTDCPYL